ncbi:MAG: hypothetical protein B655_0813 [Methanobacterium sp. Maddingley MBC34]|nr:MAG: hypothetical protein B655_0813 [Methanobacterium sp. Maddingley MBC34]
MPISNKNFFIEKRWALLAIFLGTALGFFSAIICIAWNLVIFGFNIMYIVSPLLAGVVETTIAIKKYGKSTGAISALLTFFLINGYGWFGPGWIFPKEPVTLSLITIIAIILTIQAAFPIFVNHILFVVVPGIFTKIIRVLVRTPTEMILKPLETEPNQIDRQIDDFFLDELTIPLVSVPNVNGEKIKSYIGLVVGESITQEEEPEERLLKILKMIEPVQLDDMNLGEARKGAISRMLENAESMGANAVVEVLIDYVSMGGLQGSVTIVTATGTAVIVEDGGIKKKIPKVSENDSGGGESIRGTDEKLNGSHIASTDESSETGLFLDESDDLISDFELSTKDEFGEELEKRFINVSKDLNGIDKIFAVAGEYTNTKINTRENILKSVHKYGYEGMSVMKIKEEIIGKEVVDVNALVIGKVRDVEVNFQTKTMEAFIVGGGGFLESLGSSKNDIIVPENMVIAIGDKILVKTENQSI